MYPAYAFMIAQRDHVCRGTGRFSDSLTSDKHQQQQQTAYRVPA